MKSLFESRPGSRARRVALLLAISVVALSFAASRHRARSDDVVSIWSPAFGGGGERNIERYATSQVQPPYPVAAERYRIEGTVTVQVTVNKDGKVVRAEFVRGHTVFRSVSLDAAKQWQFQSPDNAGLEGEINFSFKLK